ncbi:LAETG motif-containing sortase-dependent surface protein [Kitasatospora sp. NPDC001683]
MHSHVRRGLPMLTALGLTVGVTALAAPAAHAEPDCGRAPVQYSVDGGAHWTNDATMPAESGSVQVRLAGVPTAGCDYHVSLGSYATQGATWATSGQQTFLGWATTTLTREHYRDTLDVTGHLPRCYGELALYSVGEKYDGSDSDHPLPHYPDEPFSGLGIASWNGGTACAPTPTPTAAPTSAAPTPTPTAAPATSAAVPTPPPGGPTASPRADQRTPAAATATPTATATAAPALAATGADDGLLIAAGVAAAALVAAGGAAAYVGRRR